MIREFTVLGFDPALRSGGWGAVKVKSSGRLVHVAHGLISTNRKMSITESCGHIHAQTLSTIYRIEPDWIAYEYPFLKGTRAARDVHSAIGSMLTAFSIANYEPISTVPSEWKKLFIEYVGSKVDSSLTKRADKKSQTLEAVKVMFPELSSDDISPESDCWDALGVASWLALVQIGLIEDQSKAS